MARLSDIAFTKQPATPTARQRMTETAAGLLSYVPFFATLFYDRMKVVWVPKDHWIPTMATDGLNVIINEEWWSRHDIHERIFVLCHEILHGAYDDCGRGLFYYGQGTIRGLPYIKDLANQAMDYRINATLVDAKVGRMPKEGCYDVKIAKGGETFEEVYEKLYKEAEKQGRIKKMQQPGKGKGKGDGAGKGEGKDPGEGGQGGGEGQGDGRATGQIDVHLDPQAQQSPAERAQRKAEWDQALNAAKAAAKAVGNMPGALEALVDDLLDVQIKWTEVLQKFMRRHTKGIGHRTYKTLNKRKLAFAPQLVLPGRSGFGAENVVCVFDTSGSMGEQEFKQVISEAANILVDVRPRTLWVIQGDAEVGDVKRLPEGAGVRELMYRKGFGGTDFRPPFKRVEELGIKPEVLVYFTDLYGPFPDEPPNYPVIWCAVNEQKAPWGETIHVDLKASA